MGVVVSSGQALRALKFGREWGWGWREVRAGVMGLRVGRGRSGSWDSRGAGVARKRGRGFRLALSRSVQRPILDPL